MNARYSWGIFYLVYWVYRSAYSVIGEVVIARLTSLGDATRYQASTFSILNSDVTSVGFITENRAIATQLTESIGAVFFLVSGGNSFAINIGFQTIAFVGIVVLLRTVVSPARIWLAVLLLLPSFNIWSSVAGKEALVVFALGIISSFIIMMYQGRARLRWFHALAFLLVFLLKDHYLPALLFIIGGTFVCRHVRQKSFLVLFGGIVSLVPLYFFRQRVDELAFGMLPHFLGTGNSTREAFWVSQYDVFYKAPYGMVQGFLGPTLAETSAGILQLSSFVESTLIVAVLVVFTLVRLPRLPAYMVFMSGFTILWILFATYPFGIMNPGSAIRYRTGYEMLVFVAIVFLLSRDTFIGWRGRRGDNEGAVAAPPK